MNFPPLVGEYKNLKNPLLYSPPFREGMGVGLFFFFFFFHPKC